MQQRLELPIPDGYALKWVAYITTKSGHRIYARERGKKAFPIIVKKA